MLMPIWEGGPDKPKRVDYETPELYIVALEKYIEALEDKLDIMLFNEGL